MQIRGAVTDSETTTDNALACLCSVLLPFAIALLFQSTANEHHTPILRFINILLLIVATAVTMSCLEYLLAGREYHWVSLDDGTTRLLRSGSKNVFLHSGKYHVLQIDGMLQNPIPVQGISLRFRIGGLGKRKVTLLNPDGTVYFAPSPWSVVNRSMTWMNFTLCANSGAGFTNIDDPKLVINIINSFSEPHEPILLLRKCENTLRTIYYESRGDATKRSPKKVIALGDIAYRALSDVGMIDRSLVPVHADSSLDPVIDSAVIDQQIAIAKRANQIWRVGHVDQS